MSNHWKAANDARHAANAAAAKAAELAEKAVELEQVAIDSGQERPGATAAEAEPA